MNKKRVYLGTYEGEELYINLEDQKLDGWSLMGLRPETEESLKELQRDQDPNDWFDLPEWADRYFNYELWEEDRVSEWYEYHDVQGQYEKEGEVYYLGFGMGTSLKNFFKRNNIETFQDYVSVVEDVPMVEQQFRELSSIVSEYEENPERAYSRFLKWQKQLPEAPKGCEVLA